MSLHPLLTLAAHRTARAHRRELEHELAGFRTPAERLEIETIAARYSDEDSREVRAILSSLAV